MKFPQITLNLPPWISPFVTNRGSKLDTIELRMQFVIELARQNLKNSTGGPFGAGIFDRANNKLLSVGVNCVTAENCCVAHAEIMAIMMAQKNLGHFDLGNTNSGAYELVTSTEPCGMCLGALTWSGIQHLVCGARDEDARSIGFDEGPKPENWILELKNRGISVIRDLYREKAKEVLSLYKESGGIIYNGQRP